MSEEPPIPEDPNAGRTPATAEEWIGCGCCAPDAPAPTVRVRALGQVVTATGVTMLFDTSNSDPVSRYTRYSTRVMVTDIDEDLADVDGNTTTSGSKSDDITETVTREGKTSLDDAGFEYEYVRTQVWNETQVTDEEAAWKGSEEDPPGEWEEDVPYTLTTTYDETYSFTAEGDGASLDTDDKVIVTAEWEQNVESANFFSGPPGYGLVWDGTKSTATTSGVSDGFSVAEGAGVSDVWVGTVFTRTVANGTISYTYSDPVTMVDVKASFDAYALTAPVLSGDGTFGSLSGEVLSRMERLPFEVSGSDVEEVVYQANAKIGQWRFKVDDAHAGTYFAVKYRWMRVDVVDDEVDDVVESEGVVEWEGPGDEEDGDDESWFSDWQDAPETEVGYAFRLEVTHFRHTQVTVWEAV